MEKVTRGLGISLAAALVLTSCGLVNTAGGKQEATLDRIVLPSGREIRIGQPFDVLREQFVPRSTLFQAKDNASLFIGVEGGVVAAIMSTGTGGVSVPGFRFGLTLKSLGWSSLKMEATELAGRPGMVLDRAGVRFFAIALPDNMTCEFRGTADQVVMTSGGGEDLVREFLIVEQPCLRGDDKSELA